jgi:MFS transporter, PPP family, 3-phenylpropionic acid transporter
MQIALFFFLLYGATGILMPYLTKYLQELGFNGKQFGFLALLSPLVMIFAPPLWGFVADRTGKLPLLLKLACVGAAASFTVVLFLRGLAPLAVVFCVYAFFWAPATALADTVALAEARRLGIEYARLRLWGSIGFIVAVSAAGGYLQCGGRLINVLASAALLMVAYALMALRLDVPREALHYSPPSLKDAWRLAKEPAFLLFLLAGMVHWAALGPYYLLFTVHMTELAVAPVYIAAGFSLGVVAEIIMMWRFQSLRARVPLFGLLVVASLVSAARWYLVSAVQASLWLAVIQICHGFSFGAFYVACIAHLERVTPAPLRATSRALFSSVAMGMGGVLGYILAGVLYDRGHGGLAFRAAALLELLVPLLLLAAVRARRKVAAPVPVLR